MPFIHNPKGLYLSGINFVKSNTTNLLLPGYKSVVVNNVEKSDMQIALSTQRLYISNRGMASAAELKESLQGQFLYYELATPKEYVLDEPFALNARIDDWGTEVIDPQGTDAQGVPVTSPFRADIIYREGSVVDDVKNLKEYKQDKIPDITTIRSNARDGANALQQLPSKTNTADLLNGTIIPALSKNISGKFYDNSAEFICRPTADHNDIDTGTAMFESVKGNTVAWNQLVQDGNFKQGLTHFVSYRATAEMDNEVVKVTPTVLDNTCGFSTAEDSLKWIENHKYLLRAIVKGKSGNCLGWSAYFGSISDYYYFELNGQWQDFSRIITATSVLASFYSLRISVAQINTTELNPYYIKSMECIDLTKMFGAGNEPSTIAEFDARFPESYYPYNPGTLLSMNMTGLETTGVNLFREDSLLEKTGWSKSGEYYTAGGGSAKVVIWENANHLQGQFCIKFTGYYVGGLGGAFRCYFENGATETISLTDSETTRVLTMGSKKLLKYIDLDTSNSPTVYIKDIQVALYHSGGETPITYHPYEKHIFNLDVSNLTSGGVKIFPDGMKSAGTVHDELTDVINGVFTRAIKRIEKVKMKYLNYEIIVNPTYLNRFASIAAPQGIRVSTANAICPVYCIVSAQGYGPALTEDKTFNIASNGLLQIHDSAYSDATTFKNHFTDDDYLYYELATPVEYVLDVPVPASYSVNDWGTETLTPTGINSDGVPATSPLIAEIQYGINVADTVKNIPHTYRRNDVQDVIDSRKQDKIMIYSSLPSSGILPNTYYDLGTLTENKTITLVAPSDNTVYNEYTFSFSMGSTLYNVVLPTDIKWRNAPLFRVNHTYEVSISNGRGTLIEWED